MNMNNKDVMDDNKETQANETNETSPFTPDEATTGSAPEAVTTAEVTERNPRTGLKVAIGGALVLAVAALAWFTLMNDQNRDTMNTQDGASMASAPDLESVPDVVATVNGVEISGDDYRGAYAQAYQLATQQGLSPEDSAVAASLQEQSLDVLINTQLLLNAAAEAGVEVSDEAVATEVDTFTAQVGGEAALAEALTNAGITMDTFEANIREQLTIDAYFETLPEFQAQAEVTEEMVEARYNEIAATGTELPPLTEVSAAIEAQLTNEAQQTVVESIISDLRTNAAIEINL